MPAEVESMFYQHDTPWHGEGTYIDHAPTAKEAILAAGLNWKVNMEPVYLHNPDGSMVQLTADDAMYHRAVVRETDRKVLAVLGSQYKPLQNEDAFDFFDPFVKSGHFEYETAGSLREGRRVWVLASFSDGTKEVVKGDAVKAHVLLSNTHDGSGTVQVLNTSVRVVCWNTLQMALGEGNVLGRIKHTRNMALKMSEVQDAVAAMHKSFQHELRQYRALAKVQVGGTKELTAYVNEVLGKPADAKVSGAGAQIIQLFEKGRGSDLKAGKGTYWRALNAVTEYADHVRGRDPSDVSSRMEQAWFGAGNNLKNRALEVALKAA